MIRKSTRCFSRIPIDQAHGQNNAMVKGGGGAVSLTKNPSALRRWIASGSEVATLVNEFETSMPTRSAAESGEKHHEDTPSLQSAFHKDVTSLVCTIEDMGNPFMEDSEDLVVLDNKEMLGSDAVAVKLRTVEEVGLNSMVILCLNVWLTEVSLSTIRSRGAFLPYLPVLQPRRQPRLHNN